MKRYAVLAALEMLLSGTVFGGPAAIGQDEVLSRVDSHQLVAQARITLAIKTETLAAESGWRGATISLLPSMRYDDATGALLLAEAAIGADLSFPLGTSRAERERKLQAGEQVTIARAELDASIGKAFADLFSLYAAGYSSQEALTVAKLEEELARLRLDTVNQRKERGLSSISDQADAEAKYQAAAERTIQAGLDARLAWFKLANAAGLETARPGAGMPAADHGTLAGGIVFELPALSRPDLDAIVKAAPQPGVLMTTAKERSPAALAQRQRLAAAGRALEDYAPLGLSVTPRLLYATPSVSASIGYGTTSGAITLGADWSPYADTAASSSKTPPPENSFSFSIAVGGSVDPRAADEKAALRAALRLEELRLLALEQDIELSVRSAYAAYLKAEDSLAEAERSRGLALEISQANQARGALGQLSQEDELADAVLLARSSFNVEKARASLGQAYLSMIAAGNAWNLANLTIHGAKP